MLLDVLFSTIFFTIALGAVNFGLQHVAKQTNDIFERLKKKPPVENCSVTSLAADKLYKCEHHFFIVNQKGSSLLEILICSIIGMTLFSLAMKEVSFLTIQALKKETQTDMIASFNEWSTLFQQAITHQDLARIPGALKIFENPPAYADGSKLKLTKPVHTESSGFAGVSFFKLPRIMVERIPYLSLGTIETICYSNDGQKLPKTFDAFIVTDTDIVESWVDFEPIAALGNPQRTCGIIDISPVKKPLFYPLPAYITFTALKASARAIIPLSERYLYFLDQEKTLRRMQFFKDDIIEQQPVKTKMFPVLVTQQFDFPTPSYEMTLKASGFSKLFHHTASSLSLLSIGLAKE